MNETYETEIQGKATGELCESLVTHLENMNYAIAALAKEATPETLQLLTQIKKTIYSCLLAAREVKERHKKATSEA